MNAGQDLKALRKSLLIGQTELATELGIRQPSVAVLENLTDRIPRVETAQRLLGGINAILARRGSARRVTWDELWAAICVGRLGVLPVPPPDVASDLTRVEQPAAAPSAEI